MLDVSYAELLEAAGDCGCPEPHVMSGHVMLVSTCPKCLPVGAITWLIENGRQLELFEERGVTDAARRDSPNAPTEVTRSDPDGSDLPF